MAVGLRQARHRACIKYMTVWLVLFTSKTGLACTNKIMNRLLMPRMAGAAARPRPMFFSGLGLIRALGCLDAVFIPQSLSL